MESFSNWREETTSDPGEADDAGVNLAGARYQSSAAGSSRGGCAIHGWSAPHHTADCNVVKAMDSDTWLRTARATNACMTCGEWFRRGHQCLSRTCDECGRPGHAAFRCRHRDSDRRGLGRTPSTAAPYSGGPPRDRRRHPDPAPPVPSSAKRSRSNPRDKRAKGAPRERSAGDSQPPAPSPSERPGRGRGSRGKRSPGGKPKTPNKE